MKKKIMIALLLFGLIFQTKIVKAASGSLSVSSRSVIVGNSFTVSVYVNQAAAWNVHVTASGPVSGCTIHQADATADAMNTSKSFQATCTATGAGTINISLSGDVTGEDGGNSGLYGSTTVTVSNPAPPPTPDPTPTPTPTPSPSPTPAPSYSPTPSNNNNNNNNNRNDNIQSPVTAGEEKSSNTNIREISVEKFELKKDDDVNYSLTVNHIVEEITIKASAEDEKSSIKGANKVKLKEGDNKFEIVVTAENGDTKTYYVNVKRKENEYPISDIDNALKEKDKIVSIIIKDEDKITKDILDKIKKSKKQVSFKKVDDEKNDIYTWTIDGNKLGQLVEFSPKINFEFKRKDKFDTKAGFRTGKYIELSSMKIPKSTLKINVKNTFKDGEKVNVYYYDEDKNEIVLVKDNIIVKDNEAEFSVTKGKNYFITRATIDKTSKNYYKPLAIIESVALVVLGILLFQKNSSKNESKYESDNSSKKDKKIEIVE